MLRQRVYDAALALFRERGFEATTVEEIARKAQVAKGTVFNFFPTKGAILLRYYEDLDAEFGAAMTTLSPTDPRSSLTEFYGKAEALLRKEGPLAADMFRQIALDADIKNADLDSGEKDRDQMIRFFRACQAKDTLSADIEAAVAAHIVTDLWSSTVADWLRSGQRYSLKLRLATKLDAIFKGFA
ncbi:MAG TPA: TetR/AcrR family transcriptional regulator, partial [Rhizomicrobium sp.]|nr:TetR/AcrR family transcriptional regulator [Rhizomicrobium sp.]